MNHAYAECRECLPHVYVGYAETIRAITEHTQLTPDFRITLIRGMAKVTRAAFHTYAECIKESEEESLADREADLPPFDEEV